MRHLFLSAALAVSLAPVAARAQSADDDAASDDTSLEGSQRIAPEAPSPRSSVPPPSTVGRLSAPGQQHTVTRGDTLWDLSQRYLGSPWYWPKVWSYNPEIANPHWIYPGNEVRFFAAGEEVPTQVEAGTQQEPSEQYDEGVTVFGKIGFQPKAGVNVATPGFVTNREIEESGRIVGSYSESISLSGADLVYVRFDKKAPRLGEIYVVYRFAGDVTHPVDQRPIGSLTQIAGELKITRIEKDNKTAVATIWKQYDNIYRSDLIGPMGEPIVRQVAARGNDRDVKDATIVSDVRLYPAILGENQIVIVDKGTDDGVKAGNTFTIFRQNDPYPWENLLSPSIIEDGVPRQDVGECVAFEVKANATLCLMTRSIRDIFRGDHAEVRARGSRSASR